MDDLSGAHTRAGRCDAGELAEVEGRAPDRDSSEREPWMRGGVVDPSMLGAC